MLFYAIKQIQFTFLRSVLAAFAVGASVAVILLLNGFENGLYIQSEKTVMDRGASLIVSQAGISNFLATRSSIRQLARSEVEDIPGVAQAHPMTGLPAIYDNEGVRTPIYLLVYDTLGGEVSLAKGEQISGGRDVVIDTALAKKHKIDIGDDLILSDFNFRVTGISKGTAALFMPLVFVSYDGLIDFFLESEVVPDITNFPMVGFLLVELESNASAHQVKNSIESQIDDVDVWSSQQLANNDVKLIKDMFGAIMGLLISIAYVIGLLVVGLIIYAEVNSRRRDLGVLKALGFDVPRLLYSVLLQTLVLMAIALPIGIVLTLLGKIVIEHLAPLYLIEALEPITILKTVLAAIVFSILGGLMPLRMIVSTDPTIAFQGN